ncbi:MAG TPA: hypothetical protein VK842_00780 [bacterium]|nr:hypothetical protein [bacterium]
MKQIILLGWTALCLAPSAARALPRENAPDAVSPSASAGATPNAPQEPAQPASPSAAAPADPVAPSAPSAASGTAAGPQAVDSDLPEEVGQDQGAAQTAPADLGKLDSATLARLARSLGVDAPTVWFDPDQQQPLTAAADNAESVDAAALYAALQQRSDAGDKDARQALAMARLRGDPRAEPVANAGATPTAGATSATAAALGLSPSAADALGLQALSAAAQALGLSPGSATPSTATAR